MMKECRKYKKLTKQSHGASFQGYFFYQKTVLGRAYQLVSRKFKTGVWCLVDIYYSPPQWFKMTLLARLFKVGRPADTLNLQCISTTVYRGKKICLLKGIHGARP